MSIQATPQTVAEFTELQKTALSFYVRFYYPGVDVRLTLILPGQICDHGGYWIWDPKSRAHQRCTREDLVEILGSAEMARDYIRSMTPVSSPYSTVMGSLQIMPTH